MGLKNINELQNLAYSGRSSQDLQSYSDLYLKQALANLGQRFSIQGDGVTSGSFHIYDLIPGIPVPIDEDFSDQGNLYDAYMWATVQEDENGELDIMLTAYDMLNSERQYYNRSTSLSEKDYLVIEDDLYMPGSKVDSASGGSIAYYGMGSVISDCGDGVWRTACRDMSYNKSTLDCTFNIYEYEDHRDRIAGGFRVFSIDSSVSSTYSGIYAVSLSYADTYAVTLYKVEDIDSTSNAWTRIMDSANGPIMGGCEKTWTEQTIIESMDGLLTFIGTCKATFDDDSQSLGCDSDTFENAFGSNTLYGGVVEANVLQWNEQLAKELPFLRQYYNDETYFGSNDNLKLKKRIVAEILAEMFRNYLNESEGEGAEMSVFNVLMPYEFEFIYTCNSQNPSQIYSSSKDIISESLLDPFDEIDKIRHTGNNGVREQLWICSAWDTTDSTEHIYGVWQYFLTYDKESLLRSIDVFRTYVLPYINNDGYWNINNIDTDIYARGKDGGQPSVIISYSDTATGYHEILSTLHADELTTALDWQTNLTYFQVRPLDTSTIIGSDSFHLMTTYMPTNVSTAYLHENLVTFLENAIIMDVSSVHNEVETAIKPLSDPSELGENATITTFWALKKDNETGDYSFTYVKQPQSSWAVDFNYLSDAEAIVKYYMQLGLQPDVFRHRWVVFTGIKAGLKNQESASSATTVFPTWKNSLRDSFDDMFDVESEEDMYLNNLNFVLAFYNNIEWNGSYIVNVNDENEHRFFKFNQYNGVDEEGVPISYSYVPTVQLIKDSETRTLANEWYPNTKIQNSENDWLDTLLPIFELKEVMLRDVNALNRYNILTTGRDGQMYYSYIGGTPDSPDKSVVHIGTGTTAWNLGLKTLTTAKERAKFAMNREIDIDFPTIVLNGDVIMPKASWDMYVQEGNPDNKMFQTHYEMAYIMNGEPHVFNSLEEVAAIVPEERDRYFRIPKAVSSRVADIGGGRSVEGKSTYVSYLNFNWLAQNILKITGFTDEKLRGEDYTCCAYGEAGRLFWVHDLEGTPSYFLQLTTDIVDQAERLYDYESGGYTTYFLKPNALDISYLARYTRRGTPTHVRVNVRECTSTHSTAYAMYDGGELEYND